ncbi:MAG: hypothetical protein R8M45_00320, partial [Ghiorsea sp.]
MTLDIYIELFKRVVNKEEEGIRSARLKYTFDSDFKPLKPKNILGLKAMPVRKNDIGDWSMRTEAVKLFIRDNKPLPSLLRSHALGIMSGAKQPSKVVNKNSDRDHFIACAVIAAARELDLPIMRNDATITLSACDVVAEKIFHSYKTVKAIYLSNKEYAKAADTLCLNNFKKS